MSGWADVLAGKVQEKRAPEEATRQDLYGLLLRMFNRYRERKDFLLTDEEVEIILKEKVLDPIVDSVKDELFRRFGGGGSSESTNPNAENNLIGKLRRSSAAVQESYSILFTWFLGHCDSEGEPIWAKALKVALDGPAEVRASVAEGHLVTSGERELRKLNNVGSGGALLDLSIRRALNHWKDIFEPLDVASNSGRESCSFGLKGRQRPVMADMDVESFARTLGKRTVQPQRRSEIPGQSKPLTQRERVLDLLPYPSEIVDLLKAAMEKSGCGFTIAQAKTIVHIVYDLSIQEMEPLDDDLDNVRAGAQDLDSTNPQAETAGDRPEETPIGTAATEQAAPMASGALDDQSDRMIRALEAVIAEIQRLDGVSPDKRSEDPKKGKQARYLLDFEIWDDSPLLPGEETQRLRVVVQSKHGTQPGNRYSLLYFEAWSGISDSTVSTWRGPREPKVKPNEPEQLKSPRARLIAVGASEFFGWTKKQAELEMTLKKSRRAKNFQARLYLLLRSRFLHRKPEFVSGDPFALTGTENTDS